MYVSKIPTLYLLFNDHFLRFEVLLHETYYITLLMFLKSVYFQYFQCINPLAELNLDWSLVFILSYQR